jgi:hypothetical protein
VPAHIFVSRWTDADPCDIMTRARNPVSRQLSSKTLHHEGILMTTVHVKAITTVPPDRFIAALTGFGPGRGKIWGHSNEDSVKVNARGDTWADVTEGSTAGVWERLRYDWSEPNVVRLTTTDSNAWSTESSWLYTLTPRVDGRTDIDLVAVRKGRTLKGRLIAALLAVGGKPIVGGDLRKSLAAIEHRV